jgi:hypothetical protein
MHFYQPGSFPKKCVCGALYRTDLEWQSLPFACIQSGTDEEGRRYCPDLELRNCPCGSTIAVRLTTIDAVAGLSQQEVIG